LYLIPRREREQRIDEALVMMSLRDARDRVARDYSSGMMRRLEIAQSTLHRPPILFLDEPTAGLDPGGRHAVWEHVRELNRNLGAAIVLTTNRMDEAEELCNRVAIIQSGKLRAVGAPVDLKAIFAPSGSLGDVYEVLTAGGRPRA
jgi:ABC-2 type transport system ATP-binding protein